MNTQLTSNRSVIPTGLILVFAIGLSLTFLISCGDSQQPKTADTADRSKSQIINHDSLVKAVFRFAEPYFAIHTVDSIIALKGKPQYTYKKVWGEEGIHADSLLTVGYPLLEFNFLKRPDSHLNLQSILLLDSSISLAGNMKIGKTTRQDVLRNLGLPDEDGNDGGRTMTKSGDTTAYGTQAELGDTVTFSYHINLDEYAINFAMTRDTLRKMTWVKNMN